MYIPTFQQVANPTQVTDSETNIVFNLVEDLAQTAQTTSSASSPPNVGQQQEQLKAELLIIKAEADANTEKAEADGKFRIRNFLSPKQISASKISFLSPHLFHFIIAVIRIHV